MATINKNNHRGTFYGSINNDVIYGNSGKNKIYGDGGSGNDKIYNNNMYDAYTSDASGDVFNGGIGDDNMYAGSGNDTFLIGKNDGADIISDSGGSDTIIFTDMTPADISSITSRYNALVVVYSGGQLIILDYAYLDDQIEQFRFSDGTVWGKADLAALFAPTVPTNGNDILSGFFDNYTVDGLAGDDTIICSGNGNSLNGGAGNDNITCYGDGNNILNGGTGHDTLSGGFGDDTFLVGLNEGIILSDTGGNDTVVYTDTAPADVVVSRFESFYHSLVLSSGTNSLIIRDYFSGTPEHFIERFRFSDGTVWTWDDIKAKISLAPTDGNDYLYGYDDSDDTLNGSAGDDWLYGGGGNDTLNGGSGINYLFGGAGNDTYLITKNGVQNTISYDRDGANVAFFTDMLPTDITRISHSGDALILTYDGGQLSFDDYFMSDGISINNTIRFSDGTVWSEAAIKAQISQAPTSGDDLLSDYSNSNSILMGLTGNDTLYGMGGNDTLNGGKGSDKLYGGAGDDTYLIAKNDGYDTIYEYINPYGNGFGILAVGGGGTDKVVFTNMTPDDISQVSHTVFDHGFSLNSLLLVYNSGGQLLIRDYFYSTDSRIEQFQFSDGTVWGWEDIKAKAMVLPTDQTDHLAGYDDSDNILNGLAGDDWLSAGSGNDTFDGGTGADYMEGRTGNDTYWVDNSGDYIVEIVYDKGYDTVYSSVDISVWRGDQIGVEKVVLLAGAHNATGNIQDNLLIGNAAANSLKGLEGNDTLDGGRGNDSLNGGNDNDVLIGGLGMDALDGGDGQDSFVFNTALGLSNIDTIKHFSVTDDTIWLENAIFTALPATGTLAADAFAIIGNGVTADSTDRILYNSVSGRLFYDADGNGAGAAVQIALLGKGLAMTAADFLVI